MIRKAENKISLLEIDIINETQSLDLDKQKLVYEILQFAGRYLKIGLPAEMSLTFTNDAKIQFINKIYRGKNQPTDVISFALEELGEGEKPLKQNKSAPRTLGDIIISIEQAKRQAKDYGHTFERELGFLAVHGFLHLLGYDHMTKEEEKIMFRLQEEVLEAYGLQR